MSIRATGPQPYWTSIDLVQIKRPGRPFPWPSWSSFYCPPASAKQDFKRREGNDWFLQSCTFFILSLRAASSSLWTDWITGSSPSPVNLEFVNISKPINAYQMRFFLQTNRSHLSSSFSWRAATSFSTRCSSLAPWIYLSCLCFATFQSFLLCFLFFFTTIFTSLFNCPIIICLKSSWRPSPFAACPPPTFPSYSANPSDSSSCPELQLSPNKSLLSPSTKNTSLVQPTSSW